MENIVWSSNEEIVSKNFNYMIKNYYNHFNFKYNWDNNELIRDYLKRLFINSFIECEEIRNDLPQLIHDVEDFFSASVNNRYFTKSNISLVFTRIKNNIKTLGYTKNDSSKSEYLNKSLLINKDLRTYLRSEKQTTLSPAQVRKIYVFRELTKQALNVKDTKLIDLYNMTVERVIEEKNKNVRVDLDKSLIVDGFEMIEDLLSQNYAEELVYKLVEKDRPKFRVVFENNYPVASNLDDRCLYQKQVADFGKTLAGISNKSELLTLINMTKLAFEASLAEAIIAQYKEGNAQKYYDLFILLQNFGVLRRGSMTDSNGIVNIDYKKVFWVIEKITNRNLSNNLLTISTIKPLNLDTYLNA